MLQNEMYQRVRKGTVGVQKVLVGEDHDGKVAHFR